MTKGAKATMQFNGEEAVIIAAPHNFSRHIIYTAGDNQLGLDAIERAERELSKIAKDFPKWMRDEIATLMKAYAAIRDKGWTEATRNDLYLACHTLRGQAQTLNYPLVGIVSESLCNLLDRLPLEQITMALIDVHINAARAMVDENATGNSNTLAQAVTTHLSIACEKAIKLALINQR